MCVPLVPLVRTRICFFLRIMNNACITPNSRPAPLPNVYDPLLMIWMCGQPVQVQISTISLLFWTFVRAAGWAVGVLGWEPERVANGRSEQQHTASWEDLLMCDVLWWNISLTLEHPIKFHSRGEVAGGATVRDWAQRSKERRPLWRARCYLPPGDGMRGHVAGINHLVIGPTKNCN